MTKQDRQKVADILRYCEGHCDDDTERDIVAWVAEKFAEDFARNHPRVSVADFMNDAVPTYQRELRARITA